MEERSIATFAEVCEQLDALQRKKGADYGSGVDPLANLRASAMFGIPPWMGAIVRLNDKINRISSFARKGSLENESVEDSLRDIAVYSIHALRLYQEENGTDFD
jgi:hypothetical protein